MKNCCANTLVTMQVEVELGGWLKLMLAASPFILIIPDLDPTQGTKELAGAVAEKMSVMTAQKALDNIKTATAKPDFLDAVQAVDFIILDRLRLLAAAHIARHAGSSEMHVWSKLGETYDSKFYEGIRRGKEKGWFSWLPF